MLRELPLGAVPWRLEIDGATKVYLRPQMFHVFD